MKRALLLACLLAGCGEVTVTALTAPPPGKTAVLDGANNTLALSRGVAFAFECNANSNDYSGPCREAEASSADAAIASVYRSYTDSLAEAWDDKAAGPRARTAFVVVAFGAGTTELRITTADGDVTVDVTVE